SHLILDHHTSSTSHNVKRRLQINKYKQGRTDNSWGPQAIGDHGAPVPLPKTQKSL
ncbi:unnamed protein product, partial [Staurois parvus]